MGKPPQISEASGRVWQVGVILGKPSGALGWLPEALEASGRLGGSPLQIWEAPGWIWRPRGLVSVSTILRLQNRRSPRSPERQLCKFVGCREAPRQILGINYFVCPTTSVGRRACLLGRTGSPEMRTRPVRTGRCSCFTAGHIAVMRSPLLHRRALTVPSHPLYSLDGVGFCRRAS